MLPVFLCIEFIPILAHYPSKCRQLSIKHTPFEIAIWAKIFFPVLLDYPFSRFERSRLYLGIDSFKAVFNLVSQ